MEQEPLKEDEQIEILRSFTSSHSKKVEKQIEKSKKEIQELNDSFNNIKKVTNGYKYLLQNFRRTGKLDFINKIISLIEDHPYNFIILDEYIQGITAIRVILDQEIKQNDRLRLLIVLDTKINKGFLNKIGSLHKLSEKIKSRLKEVLAEFKKQEEQIKNSIRTKTNYAKAQQYAGDLEDIQERTYEIIENIKETESKNVELLSTDSNVIAQYDKRLLSAVMFMKDSVSIQKDIINDIRRNEKRLSKTTEHDDKDIIKGEIVKLLGQLKEEVIKQLTYINLYETKQKQKEELLNQIRIALQEINIFVNSSKLILKEAA
tara:strand:+ start:4937 stop:5890 length:954 start_codon:yes stop_codon:yes gene_type:complete